MTDHFSEQSWIDFVRGVVVLSADTAREENVGDGELCHELQTAASAAKELQAHLESGCTSCTATAAFWKEIYSIASQESGYCPPEDVVRMAKLEFSARQVNEPQQAQEAALVFDSFSRPVLAGVRSAAAAARQMVYEAGGLTVDLRFDSEPYSSKVHMVGQILNHERSLGALKNLAVMLWTEKGLPVADSETNEFGEFHLEFEAQDNLRLSVQVPGRDLIRIALTNLQLSNGLNRTVDGADAGNS